MSDSRQRRSGLGRGLSALIVNTDPEAPAQAVAGRTAETGGVLLVPTAAVRPNPRQPRTHFDDAALDALATSIREHGILQPLIVTADPQQPDRYWLVAGERRLRAAERAGIDRVPVLVREAGAQQRLELALIENLQRADLNPLEEAAAYQSLLEEFGLTQAEVAERVGKSRPAVANAVRLLALPAAAQHALVEGAVSAGHARALLALPEAQMMDAALGEITRKSLNVRQAEALVKRMLEGAQAPPSAPEDRQVRAQIARMEDRFRTALGTRVSLNRNADGSGRLVVHFYNDDDLDAIYQAIAGRDDA
jgi:ParB family transcriptional regulator, chromosome partitioning protein